MEVSNYLFDVVTSLKKEFPNVNIKEEILNGIKLKMNFFKLFDKKITIFHPYSEDKIEIHEYISKRLNKMK